VSKIIRNNSWQFSAKGVKAESSYEKFQTFGSVERECKGKGIMRTIRNSFSSLAIIGGLIGSLNFIQAAGVPMLGDGGDGGTNGSFTSNYTPLDYGTNLWLEITGVSNGLAYLNLRNATNEVYEVWSKTDLLVTNWDIEQAVWPTNQDTTSFTVPQLDRTSLFIWARDWTDITSGDNDTPEWWFWKYFGTVALSDNNLDSQGNTLLYDYQNSIDPNIIYFSLVFTNQYVNTNPANGTIVVSDGVPFYMAVLINSTDFADAIWQPYNSNVVVSLNAGDGDYDIWIGLRGLPQDAQQTWHDVYLTLDTIPPTIVITNPIASVVSQPVIQLQGYSTEPLDSLSFDVANAAGVITNLHGYIIGTYYDENLWTFTTNWFHCLDVALTNGLNTITLHATDWAGNMTTTNVSLTLDYSNNTNPPALTVTWPQDGTYIGGSQFTFEGEVNDPTVTVTAQIVDANGETNTVPGLVEHSGLVWVQNLPLADGENSLTVTAMDAAGNTSSTNITVTKSIVTVTMDPISGDQVNQSFVNVFGTVSDPSCIVTVNGVPANVNEYGNWEADNVPVNATGTAVFDVEVYSGSSFNAAVRPNLAFSANDTPNNTLIDSQLFTSPQPPKVVLSSFWSDLYYQGAFWFGVMQWGTAKINWISGEGGTWWYAGVHGTEYGTQFSSGENNLPTDSIAGLFFRTQIGRNSSVVTATCWYTNKSKVIIVPQGQTAAGTTNLYLVRASALEFSDPYRSVGLGDPGDLPLPPEWLQIQGQTLVNTGETNTANSSVWGETIVSAPAGETVEVTPMAIQFYANWNYTFDVKATNIDLQLAVDANRDGNITFDQPGQINPDQTTDTKPYRFWINDNHDGFGNIWNLTSVDSVQEDLNPSTGNDATSNSISCTRDLEDYTRLWMNVQGITNELQNGTFLLALQWENVTGSPAIRIFPAVEINGGTFYLTDTNMAQAQITAPFGTNIVDQTGQQVVANNAPFFFTTSFWSNFATNPVTYLIFDGVSSGSGKLVLAIYKNDGVTKLAESQPLYLNLNEITNMYERWTVGEGNGGTPATTAWPLSDFQYTSSSPEANQYILFVHGWNVSPQVKDAFANTAYKRLWWQGYKGRLGAFRWPTLYNFPSWSSQGLNLRNYDESESNAWASATGLVGLLTSLDSQYPNSVYVFAHSQGNVVVGEALRQGGTIQLVNTYVACQAAVSAHAYDPTTSGWQSIGTSNSPDSFASWTNGEPYFNGVTSAESCGDLYNTNDWALNLWRIDQTLKPDHGITFPGYYWDSPSGTHPSGFYKIAGSVDYNLYFPDNTYEIFAFCVQSPCYALGATPNVHGFTMQSMPSLWQYDPFETETDLKFSDHPWHSAEFLFTSAEQWNFWKALMGQFGLPTNQ